MKNIARLLTPRFPPLLLALSLAGAGAAAGADNPWTSIGPFGQSANVRALAVDPTNPSTIYAGTADLVVGRGGLFKSADSGQSWTRQTIPLTYVLSIVVDPGTPSTVYAAGGSIVKSMDAGATWRSVYTGVSGNLFSLAMAPSSSSTLYAAGGEHGVLKSSDGGETWVDVGSGLPPFYPGNIAVDPTSPSTVYLAADGQTGGVFKSTDGGQSWTRLNGVGTAGAQTVFVSPLSSPTVYASTSSGVFRSPNGGMGWASASTGLQGGGLTCFAADPVSNVVYAGSGVGVFRSTDDARTWTPLGPSSLVWSLALGGSPAPTIYAGTDSTGVFRSPDGGTTWTASSFGLTGATVTALGVEPTTPSTLYAGLRRGQVFKSVDRGAHWIDVSPGPSEEDVSAFAFDPSASGTVYVARSREGLFKTVDGGASWNHADSGLSVPPFYGSQYITALLVDPVTPTTLYAGLSAFAHGGFTYGYVFKSTNGGESWAQLPVFISQGFTFALAVDPRSLAIYAPGARSTDAGATWQVFDNPCGGAQGGSISVATDSTVYMACGGSVHKSTDGEQSWVTLEAIASQVVVDPASPLTVYAGGPDGVLRTLDGGATWSFANDGLTDSFVTALAIDPANPARAYAGTLGTGVFTKDFSGLSQPLCVASPTTLCLVGNRFKVDVSWNVPADGRHGAGMASPLTSDTGDFWFFDQANVDLVVKVLDGRAVNGSFWVFYGALSNVEYTIRVTDTETGVIKTYENASGTLASEADTEAFPPVDSPPAGVRATGIGIEKRTASELYGMYAALTDTRVLRKTDAAPCSPGAVTLCLNQARFQVTVDWEVPSQGRSGSGSAVPLTSDTGYFWFFGDANVELVVKVLDGQQINGHYWVFYGALSNVAYTVTVTDTATGAFRTYSNADGNLASVADIAAF